AREGRTGFAGRLAVDRWEDHRHSAGWRPPSSIRAPRGLNGSRVTDSRFPSTASTATVLLRHRTSAVRLPTKIATLSEHVRTPNSRVVRLLGTHRLLQISAARRARGRLAHSNHESGTARSGWCDMRMGNIGMCGAVAAAFFSSL